VSDALFPLVPEYVLGTLPPDQTRWLQAALASSPALAREVDGVVAAFTRAAEALPPAQPDATVRARLLRTLGGVDRFAPFLTDIAGLLDLTVAAARGLLARIDDPAAWEPALPGMAMQHFQAGPRFATADAGFVRLQPGISFPRHRHLGPEATIVLEGAMLCGDQVHGPGDILQMAEDTVHAYAATADRDLVILTIQNGIVPVF
jgi:putative transcriptional regulator